MAFMPLAFETRSDAARASYTRSPMTPTSPMDYGMPSSRGNTSPHHFSTGHAIRSPRDRLSPVPHEQVSPRGFHREAYPASNLPGHMTEASFHNRTSMPHQRSRKSKASSHRRRRSPDSSLLAVGSWSNHSHHGDDNQARTGRFDYVAPIDDEIAAKSLSMDSASGLMDDFVLFPDDTAEDAVVTYEEALPPHAPRISRLRTPDLAPMSTDVQFFPCLGDEREEDRINEAWYLAGREKVDSQRQYHSSTHSLGRECAQMSVPRLTSVVVNDALAYMAGTGGRRKRLGN